jgi:hypothetical protein
MYCSSCGSESTPGLNYCKHCGNNLSPGTITFSSPPATKPGPQILPVAAVSIVGLVGLFAAISELSKVGVDPRAIIGVSAFAGATVVGVVGLLIWFVLRLSGSNDRVRLDSGIKVTPRNSTQARLDAPPASIPSVTENTTRSFDAARLRDREADH